MYSGKVARWLPSGQWVLLMGAFPVACAFAHYYNAGLTMALQPLLVSLFGFQTFTVAIHIFPIIDGAICHLFRKRRDKRLGGGGFSVWFFDRLEWFFIGWLFNEVAVFYVLLMFCARRIAPAGNGVLYCDFDCSNMYDYYAERFKGNGASQHARKRAEKVMSERMVKEMWESTHMLALMLLCSVAYLLLSDNFDFLATRI